MATLVVTYPAEAGAHFDRDYYVDVHLPLAMKHFGPAGMTDAKALFPLGPDSPYLCVGILTFRDPASLAAAVAVPGAAEVNADIPKFTNVTPSVAAMA